MNSITNTTKCPSVLDLKMHNGVVQTPYTLESALVRIYQLEKDVARKYAHVRKLKKKYLALQMQYLQKSQVLDSQSATVNITKAEDNTKAQITTFADESAGWSTKVPTQPDSTFNLANNQDSDLGNFLSRPINIATYQWAVDQPLFETIKPWSAYLSNPFIRNKIQNFELLRMNLHMKVLISGTPFHYGRALVSYNPLNGFDEVTIERGFGTVFDADLIGASQKPHIFLNPTLNAGGVLELPYFYKDNYISVSESLANIADNLGEVTLRSFGNLRHTDGGNPVTINVYLWATEVTLTMPTSRDLPPLTSQSGVMNSGDEYGQGIISKPASAIAKAAGALKSIPLIMPYARATEMVATKVGDIARLFGYSRPAVLTDPGIMKPMPAGNVANIDAADAVVKLTFDSKNEVTIDPRVTGLEARDEMGVIDYVKRESYLTTFNWTSDANPGDMLWNCRVAPDLFGSVNYTTPTLRRELHMTPMCHMAQLFKYWQGSIKFRFQVVKSAYHKGRMLIRYDPRSLGANIDYNTNYSRVIDIAEAEDFEITIGWGQFQPWLECEEIDGNLNYSPSTRLSELFMRACNGVIELDVINELVSPSADSDISVNVYVSMCDDAKFADPDALKIRSLNYFRHPQEEPPPPLAARAAEEPLESQSGLVMENDVDEPNASMKLDTIASEGSDTDQTMNVYFGESITSIREMIKRYVMTRYWCRTYAKGPGDFNIMTLTNKTFPYQQGYDPLGVDNEEFGKYNFSNMNPLSFFQPCYAGYRGSVRHKYLYHTAGMQVAPIVTRNEYQIAPMGTWLRNNVIGDSSTSVTKFCTRDTWQGAAVTGTQTNSGLEVEFPFYNRARMGYSRLISARTLDCPTTKSVFATGLDFSFSSGTDDRIAFQQWTAAGEDFSFYFFTGVPVMYQYVEE